MKNLILHLIILESYKSKSYYIRPENETFLENRENSLKNYNYHNEIFFWKDIWIVSSLNYAGWTLYMSLCKLFVSFKINNVKSGSFCFLLNFFKIINRKVRNLLIDIYAIKGEVRGRLLIAFLFQINLLNFFINQKKFSFFNKTDFPNIQ